MMMIFDGLIIVRDFMMVYDDLVLTIMDHDGWWLMVDDGWWLMLNDGWSLSDDLMMIYYGLLGLMMVYHCLWPWTELKSTR